MNKHYFAKKTIVLLLVFTLVLPTLMFSANVFAAQSAFNLIEATSLDKELSKSGQGNLQFMANRIGSIWPQGYLVYRNIDFGKTSPLTVEGTAGARAGHATAFKIMIDSPNSEPIAVVPVTQVEFAVGVTNSVPLLTKVTGVHDVYITTTASTMNFFSFQFFGVPKEEATYEKYSGKSPYADVEDEDMKRSIDLLSQLGMFELNEEIFDANMPVTRGEFAQSVYGIYKDLKDTIPDDVGSYSNITFSDVSPENPYSDAIRYLAGIGIMKGIAPDIFSPMGFISEIDALTVLVRALGFEQMAELKGGYPRGYLAVASNSKLASGTAYGGDTLRRGSMVNLLCSALEASYLSPAGIVGEDIIYEKTQGLLSSSRHIYHGSGTVLATQFSMLGLPETNVPVNTVVIGDDSYKVGKTYANDLLGMDCDFYYEERDGVKTLRAIIPSFDTEITYISSAKDKIFDINNDEIVYAPQNKEKEEKIKITNNSHIIYNGVAAELSLEDMLDHPENFMGTIRVVENSDNSQCIIVEEYADYIVSSIAPDQSSITTADGKGTIKWSSNDNMFIKDAAGENVKFKNIKSGDLLTVYESKNSKGEKLFRVFISDSTVEGSVNEISGDEFYIDGVLYRISNNADKLELGQESIFRLNIYGDIVKAEQIKPDTWANGLFMGCDRTEPALSEKLLVKIITTSSKPEIYEVAERLTVDGNSIRTYQNKKEILQSVMEAEEAVRYRINSSNQLYALDTYRYGDRGHDDILNRLHANNPDNKTNFMYIMSALSLFNKKTDSFAFYTPKTATVFAFYGKKGDPDRENNCVVDTAEKLMKSSNYNVWGDFYSTSGSDYAVDIVVWSTFTDSLDARKHFVYETCSEGVNSEGEPIKIIKGWCDGGKVSYKLDLTGKYDTDASAQDLLYAKPGDVYRLKLFADDTIQKAECWFYQGGAEATERPNNKGATTYLTSLEKRTRNLGSNDAASSSYSISKAMLGRITEKSSEYMVLQVEGIQKPFVFKVDGNVCIVEKTDNQYYVNKATMDNISIDDSVFVFCASASPQTIVIYKDGLEL